MTQKKKKFLHFPEYPGGKTEFKKFITDNLIYPVIAIRNKTEGIVFLSAQIDDNGIVGDVRVEKGIGDGCDEEAVRLISLLKYGSVSNRGYRIKTRKQFRIHFQLNDLKERMPEMEKPVNNPKIVFSLSQASPKSNVPPGEHKYQYTVNIGNGKNE